MTNGSLKETVKVSRIEKNKRSPSILPLASLATLLGVTWDKDWLGDGRTGACVGRKGGDKLLITRKSNPVTATNCQDHLANWCALLLDVWRAGLQRPAAPPPVIPPQRARTASRPSVRTGYGSGRSAPPCCCLPPLRRIEQRCPDEPPPSWLLRRAMA